MVNKDQRMRTHGPWDSSIDKNNAQKLKKIIKKFGWPTVKLVGVRGATGAWLLAQHADHDVRFQEQCLKMLQVSLVSKLVPRWHYAYLYDRIQVHRGKKQLFGTQFYMTKNKRFIPRPIYKIKKLRQRRKEFGLEEFDAYLQQMQHVKERIQKNK